MSMNTKDLGTELVVQAFINECGGPVAHQLAELAQAPAQGAWGALYDQLLTATENLFTQNGKTAVEHLPWAETKMLSTCQKIYWQLFSALNPTHNIDPEDTIVSTEAKTRIPKVTIEQLALLAAKDFFSSENSSQQEPENIGDALLEKNEPESPPPDLKPVQKNRKGNLPEPNAEQLGEEPLTAAKVVERFLTRNQLELKEDLVSLHAISLSKAAERAAKSMPPGPAKHPKRVNKTMRGRWWDIAIVHKGLGGTNGEHKYKLIEE